MLSIQLSVWTDCVNHELAKHVVQAGINLLDQQKKALARWVTGQIQNLPPDQKEKLAIGIITALSTADGRQVVAATSHKINTAITTIKQTMFELHNKLQEFDTLYNVASGQDFAPKLMKHIQDFNTLSDDNHILAGNIALQASKVADVIIPKVTDAKLSIDNRKALLTTYMYDANENETATIGMQGRFTSFKDNFAIVVGTFDSFATTKIGAMNSQLVTLQAEAAELSKKIAELNAAASATRGAGIGIAAIGVGAGVAAGLSATASAGMGAAASHYSDQLAVKNTEINTLKAKVQAMEAARADLKDTSDKDMKTMGSCVGAILITWQTAQTNLHEIQSWLDKGANMADVPWAMNNDVQHVVDVYKTMSIYLTAYASGT
ncbi:hypothetical protein HD806DRAFT_550066 [Xylariaceae sp. AK1471]|nr:hypothetical protein HD806DRAFT_550066 [Xylariaceae sp. AK1471]